MKKKLIWVLSSLCLTAPLLAQTGANPATAVSQNAAEAQAALDNAKPSGLSNQLFYELLVGEITAQEGQAAEGFDLILDAARKTNDPQLYQRATDIALQSRSGELALQAAKAWKEALPQSRDANRYMLQIVIALNRISETPALIKTEIELSPREEQHLAIAAIPGVFARVSDKKAAALAIEDAMSPYMADTSNKAVSSAAWTAVGRMRLAASNPVGALEAAQNARAYDMRAIGPVLVALEAMDQKLPAAEALVKSYMADNAMVPPEIRMSYARVLLDLQRYAEATAQLQIVVRDKPDFPPAWLVLGSLELQDNRLIEAQASLERYVALAQKQAGDGETGRGLDQAYLSLSQIAQKRKDFAAAESWISKINNAEDMLLAQTRRASILASQGKLAEGRQLIRDLPEKNDGDVRLKLLAEVALLRDLKQYKMAYDLLGEAIIKYPKEAELIYDQAMMAEKLGKMGEMEVLLRRVIQTKPDYHGAYNALGYSFADRNIRLGEARELIRTALTYAPADPFIQDSLGWVEFRAGNKAESAKIFEAAFKARPDPEIAAHYGEVLWSMGQRDRALAIWREGQMLSPDNETLHNTLKRLQVKL